ncbi:hypothetical protein J6590_025709, partial [Homalodisca vitripennis]
PGPTVRLSLLLIAACKQIPSTFRAPGNFRSEFRERGLCTLRLYASARLFLKIKASKSDCRESWIFMNSHSVVALVQQTDNLLQRAPTRSLSVLSALENISKNRIFPSAARFKVTETAVRRNMAASGHGNQLTLSLSLSCLCKQRGLRHRGNSALLKGNQRLKKLSIILPFIPSSLNDPGPTVQVHCGGQADVGSSRTRGRGKTGSLPNH